MIELDNKEFQNVWRLISESSASVFMTGRAGTGKSTFLRYIVEHIKKKTVVLAPTGIAAVNAGGVTLHSFFKIPLQPFALDDVKFATPRDVRAMQKFNGEKIKLLKELELIVIDEVSMVRADVLDFVDRVLRTYNKGHRFEPFGGKQLLLVGDAFQLEPVVTGQEWDILRRFYTTPYFFGAAVFGQIQLTQIELKKVYRQKEADFLSLLDRIRVGQVANEDLELINSRVDKSFQPSTEALYMTLTSTRSASDNINESRLAELETEEKTIVGHVEKDFPEQMMPTSLNLTLKVGAQVVFVRNDMEGRWYNGSVGSVEGIEDDGVWVRVVTDDAKPQGEKSHEVSEHLEGEEYGEAYDENGELCDPDLFFVQPVMWENVKYRYNEEKHQVETELLGTFTQVPLKLAWAITIHKSQGLTFDHVIIDLGSGAFACGQSYVALSRCRTLNGMILRNPLKHKDIRTNIAVRIFSNGANDEVLIEKQLTEARADLLGRQAVTEFDKGNLRGAVADAFDALAIKPEMLKSDVMRRYVARKLSVVDKLRAQIDDLLDQQRKMREKNFEFAYEYYLLAAECLHKYDDERAAKANINKALSLAPDYADALVLRADILLSDGDAEGAVKDLNVALRPGVIKKAKKTADALLLRAKAHKALKRWERVLSDAGDALALRKDRKTLLLMAEACRKNGRMEDAERYELMADDMLNNDHDDDDDY